MKSTIITLVATSAIIILCYVLFSYGTTMSVVEPAAKNDAAIGGDFTLTDADGNVVTQERLKGQHSLVYFGFTFCPDICPTSLLTITQALQGLGTLGDKVLPVFITVDPERDTPAKIKDYIANFHPNMIGLTGTPEQVAKAAKAYKIYYALHKEDDPKNYVVDHSGYMYLMNPDGQYVTHFSHDDSAESIMATLTKYLR